MGCCFSNDEDKSLQADQSGERSPLLDPVGDREVPGRNYNTQIHQPRQQGDEQSALNRILQHTANNVIDVSAIDSHGMEQHEYMDRARHYNTQVTIVCSQGWKAQRPPWTPNGVANPATILSANPISLADIQLITTAAEQASRAVKDIKVKHKEDLVVQFGVP